MTITLEKLIDKCLLDIQAGRATFEECLVQNSDQREELEPLLALALRLQAGKSLAASPEYRSASKARLMKYLSGARAARTGTLPARPQAASQNRSTRNPRFSWLSGRALLPVVVVLLMVLILTGGVLTVSAQTLPGDALYPVKLITESLQLRVSTSELAASQVHLSAANNRIYEVETLSVLGYDQDLATAMENYNSHIAALSAYVSRDPQTLRTEELAFVQVVEETLGVNEARLSALSGTIDIDLRAILDEALQVSREARQVVRDVLASLPNYPVLNPTIPGWISETMTAYPMYTTTPPSSRPTDEVPPYRGTPTVYSNFGQIPTLIATLFGTDPSIIFTVTPSLPRLQTAWPTIYPTLVDIATRLPQITQTPRPYQRTPRPINTTPSPPSTRP